MKLRPHLEIQQATGMADPLVTIEKRYLQGTLRDGTPAIEWRPVAVFADYEQADEWRQQHLDQLPDGTKGRDWRFTALPAAGRLAEIAKDARDADNHEGLAHTETLPRIMDYARRWTDGRALAVFTFPTGEPDDDGRLHFIGNAPRTKIAAALTEWADYVERDPLFGDGLNPPKTAPLTREETNTVADVYLLICTGLVRAMGGNATLQWGELQGITNPVEVTEGDDGTIVLTAGPEPQAAN